MLAAYVADSAPPGCPVSTILKRSELLKTRCQSDFFYLDSRVVDRANRRDARQILNAPVTINPALLPTDGTSVVPVPVMSDEQRAELDAQVEAACLGYDPGAAPVAACLFF